MNSSSDETCPALHGVTFRRAEILLRIVNETLRRDLHLINVRYSDQELGFEETLEFLKAFKILRATGGLIQKGTRFKSAKEKLESNTKDFNRFLVELMLTSNTPYGEEVRSLLREFRGDDGTPKMSPLTANDTRYAVRNVLLDAKILRLDHTSGICEVPTEFHMLYTLAKHGKGASPEEIKEQAKQNLEIGFQAEQIVYLHERSIVGEKFADQVVHVAKYNASAGFDIASIRLTNETVSENRLIEVKAVGPRDHAFYLTDKEYKTAKEHGRQYFLYLVPIRDGTPNIQELTIIQDPALNVIQNPVEWETKYENLHCRRKVGDGEKE